MRRKIPSWSIIGIALVLAGIAVYNVWAYNCGFCAIQDMKTIGPQVKAVGMLVFFTVGFWAVLVFKRLRRQPSHRFCSCGRSILSDWVFCPDCGSHTRSRLPNRR